MFWNSEFVDTPPSHIDVLLQMQTVKLADILFEDDLLQELKTSNLLLSRFLTRPKVVAELVNNIANLTEKDCCDKLLYSRVHAAYISCEILTGGFTDIFSALLQDHESLNKILFCLIYEPKEPIDTFISQSQQDGEATIDTNTTDEQVECNKKEEPFETSTKEMKDGEKEAENLGECNGESKDDSIETTTTETTTIDDALSLSQPPRPKTPKPSTSETNNIEGKPLNEIESDNNSSPDMIRQSSNVSIETLSNHSQDCMLDSSEPLVTKVVPQKATLVSKIIGTMHSLVPANLSCIITRDVASFSKLINLLVNNIDISGSFEILSTFIKHSTPPDLRYVFCEILSKLNFVYSLIDVMTLSGAEDKQRNACQLLCDIVVIGRQEATEQVELGPVAQDMLAELLESSSAVHMILEQMFSEENRNSTTIVCGMKVLQTLIELKQSSDSLLVAKTIEQIQEEIGKHLIKFNELLVNPPKQEPIKTTFGIIQKPLGYMRLEVVNLIRALISTNSPDIIQKLVELKTMRVIIDLFIEYSWNNLLHTQVEQTLCLIIKNYRRDEDIDYLETDMQQQHNHQNNIKSSSSEEEEIDTGTKLNETDSSSPRALKSEQKDIPSRALLSQLLNECDLIGRLLPSNVATSIANSMVQENGTELNNKENASLPECDCKKGDDKIVLTANTETSGSAHHRELENRRRRNGEQANFGHIIQMINSIAINRDLDTIRDHLNDMKDKRPELYDRWTTFVNVDVASFKEVSLYYDTQSASNNISLRYANTPTKQISSNQHPLTSQNSSHLNNSSSVNTNSPSNGDDPFLAYFSFTRQNVLPSINADVLPRLGRYKNTH